MDLNKKVKLHLAKWNLRMVEKSSKEITPCWKLSHMLTLAVVCVSSLITIIQFDEILSGFGKHCVLYSRLNFSSDFDYQHVGDYPHNVSFHNHFTIWGKTRYCAFTRGTLLFSMVIALILLGLFIVVPKGGTAYKSLNFVYAWKLVCPAFFLSLFMSIFVFVAYFMITKGLAKFCKQFPAKNPLCTEEIDTYTLIFHETQQQVFHNINMVEFSVIILILSWSFHLLILLVRLITGADFKINKIYLYQPARVSNERTEEDMRSQDSQSMTSKLSEEFVYRVIMLPERISQSSMVY